MQGPCGWSRAERPECGGRAWSLWDRKSQEREVTGHWEKPILSPQQGEATERLAFLLK